MTTHELFHQLADDGNTITMYREAFPEFTDESAACIEFRIINPKYHSESKKRIEIRIQLQRLRNSFNDLSK